MYTKINLLIYDWNFFSFFLIKQEKYPPIFIAFGKLIFSENLQIS